MHIDWLFVGAGILVGCLACFTALRGLRDSQYRIAALLWTVLSVGLLLQGFAPHLQISRNAFVVPATLASERHGFAIAQIITRERWMQGLSSVFLFAAALGLAFHYRRLFTATHSAPRGPPIPKTSNR